MLNFRSISLSVKPKYVVVVVIITICIARVSTRVGVEMEIAQENLIIIVKGDNSSDVRVLGG